MLNAIVNAINKLTEAIKGVRIYKSIASAYYYISSSATTTITTAETFYAIAGTFSTVSEDDFTQVGGVVTYNGELDIDVLVTFSACIISDTNNVIIRFAPAINGTANATLKLCRKIATGGDVGHLSGSGFFTLSTGDTFQIMITSDTNGPVITVEHGNLVITPLAVSK